MKFKKGDSVVYGPFLLAEYNEVRTLYGTVVGIDMNETTYPIRVLWRDLNHMRHHWYSGEGVTSFTADGFQLAIRLKSEILRLKLSSEQKFPLENALKL